MNKINEILHLNATETEQSVPFESSWHQTYKDCPWVFFAGLSSELSEGDIICMFSQYRTGMSVTSRWGEVEDINLIRDHDTGKSKGFGFLRYENWLSCVLAVDNFTGMEVPSCFVGDAVVYGKTHLRRSQEGLQTSKGAGAGEGQRAVPLTAKTASSSSPFSLASS